MLQLVLRDQADDEGAAAQVIGQRRINRLDSDERAAPDVVDVGTSSIRCQQGERRTGRAFVGVNGSVKSM